MPKLIIKRESTKRFTRQALLFWGLGLVPVVLLAGFLTGNLISQLRHTSFKAGSIPMLPLAPTKPVSAVPSQPSNLPLPARSALPSDALPTKQMNTLDTEAIQAPPSRSKTPDRTQPTTEIGKPEASKKALPNQTAKANKPIVSIKPADTNDQQNNHNRPAITPSPSHKTVKSPQTVSESPRLIARPVVSTKSVTGTKAEAKVLKPAKPPSTTAVQQKPASNDDYRLLEQSLGIPLQ